MAEHGEIPTAWAGLAAAATFVGGGLAAVFGRKSPEQRAPEKGEDMAVQIARLTQRMDDADRREETERQEMKATVELLFTKIDMTQKDAAKTREDIAEIKGMLNARKGTR